MTHFVDNKEDFTRYYERSWIYQLEDDKKIPYKMMGTDGAGNITLYKYGKEKGAVKPSFDAVMEKFKFDVPSLGAISTKHGLVYATYLPERQFNKGFINARLECASFCPALRHEDLPLDSPGNVDYVYNRKYFTPDQLLLLMKTGERLGGAITPRLGLYLSQNQPHPLIAYEAETVGHVEKTHVVLYKKHRIHKTYLEGLFPNKEVKLWPKS